MAKYTISNNYQQGGRFLPLGSTLHKGGGLVCR